MPPVDGNVVPSLYATFTLNADERFTATAVEAAVAVAVARGLVVGVGVAVAVGVAPPSRLTENDCAPVPLQVHCWSWTESAVEAFGTSRHLPLWRAANL